MALSELTDRTAVLRAMAEFDSLERDAFLEKYGFGPARNYIVLENGKDYDSKALAGAAFGYQFPDRGPLRAEDFTGGENTVRRTLERLGFQVTRLDDSWSRDEIGYAVVDYLDMLAREARGESFNKTEHRERLMPLLRGRSKGSVEFKHQNISAVLNELGLPYIRGYKPRSNVQELLREVVREAVEAQGSILGAIVDQFEQVRTPRELNFQNAKVDPPIVESSVAPASKPRPRIPRKIDYAARDERNRRLGRAGEEWTVGYERYRLTELGRADLAAGVRWVSDADGDGVGYDIASFEADESSRFIEVKTTNGPALTPFVLSPTEIACSQEHGRRFYLYRVFDFGSLPRVFELRGDLTACLVLEPLDFRARIKPGIE